MLVVVDDSKDIGRHGYDLVSRVYRADDAGDDEYGPWMDLFEMRVRDGEAVLDLGCGCGVPVAWRLARRYAVTGVDLSPVQVERARALVPNATFICGDMSSQRIPKRLLRCDHLPLRAHPSSG